MISGRSTRSDSPSSRRGPGSIVLGAASLLASRRPEWGQAGLHVEPLHGGFVHDSALVAVGRERYVFKSLSTEFDRVAIQPLEDVLANTRRAGESGVGARLVEVFPNEPAVLLEFIDGTTLTREDVQQPRNLRRIASAIRRLHTHTEPFDNTFDLFQSYREWAACCRSNGYAVPSGFETRALLMMEIEAVLGVPETLVPCNNDLLAANILDEGTATAMSSQKRRQPIAAGARRGARRCAPSDDGRCPGRLRAIHTRTHREDWVRGT